MSRILGAGLTVVAPAWVFAPARAAAQTAAGLSGPPSQWHLSLGVNGTWYHNPRFDAAGESASSWSTRGRVSLSNEGRFRSGSYSISGRAGRIYYPDIKSLGQWIYGGAGTLSLTGRSSSLSLSQSYSRTNTRHLTEAEDEALPLPTTGVDSWSSSLGVGHRLSRAYQVTANVGFAWREYDNPALVGGQRLGASVSLGRSVGQDATLSLQYQFGQSFYEDLTRRVHQAALGFTKQASRTLSLSLGGGVAYLEDVGQLYPTGNAGITARGRKTSFSLGYYRDFGLAFGYGRQMIADVVGARLTHNAARDISLSARYSFGYRRDADDESYTVRSHVASAGVSWDIGAGFAFSSRYVWELNDTEGFPQVNGSRVTASLSYGVDWR